MKKLKIREDLVQKVLPQRIFALTVHPSLERVIVCIGDKWGRLGFWDVVSILDLSSHLVVFPTVVNIGVWSGKLIYVSHV